jgi:Tol biopolymer transport system component
MCKVSYKDLLLARLFLLFIACANLAACNSNKQYENLNGITYLIPEGNPPAENLVWSPTDTNKILITSSGIGSGPSNVYILDVNSKKIQTLAETQYGNLNGMAWSADGKSVIISAEPGTKGYETGGSWLLTLNDKSKQKFNIPGYTVWSPDGSTIAVIAFIRTSGAPPRGVNIHLFKVATRTNEIIYINETAEYFFGLSWSPDSKQLAFSLGDVGLSNLYILDITTREINQITHDSVSSGFPVWSQAQNIIAYQKEYYIENKLYSKLHLIRPDGTCNFEIPILDFVLSPTWSPDGKDISFISNDGIYKLNLSKALGDKFFSDTRACP